MIAELTFDLGAISSMLKYIIAALLLLISLITVIIPTLIEYFSRPGKKRTPLTNATEFLRKDSGRSSDTPPPAGFAEHLRIIEETAPNADTSVWWEYAKQEMTEAEVAIAEAKLARKPSNG